MDYGQELRFGTFLTPSADDPERVVGLAELSEESGLDLVTFQDHPYQPRFLDTWTLLAYVAAKTISIHLAPNVANLPLRPPAVLAKAAASLDLLSGGRVELGLGGGAFGDAIAAMGGPRRTPGEAVDALAEAIQIIRALWDTGDRSVARVDGAHYQLAGAKRGPAPATTIPIWLGAYKPRMLRLTGRLADGWLPSASYLPAEGLDEANAAIDAAARAAGRDPTDVRRLYNINPSGSLGAWIAELSDLAVQHGIDTFILSSDEQDTISLFADEVVPAVRSAVAAQRTRPAVEPPPATRPEPVPGGNGQHLIAIHDHLRAELSQIADLVRQVTESRLTPAQARSEINQMTVRQNNWTVGSYCASYCRMLTAHHSIEDQSVFPQLRRAEPALGPVLDRLSAEHRVVHEILERLDAALVRFIRDPSAGPELQTAVADLQRDLLAHLRGEEAAIVEPLDRLGLGLG